MKQRKIDEYRVNYPKKLLKGAILTTATAVAVAGTAGCDMLRTGGVPEPVPTDELVLDGEVGYEDPELLGYELPEGLAEPTEEPVLMGDVAIPVEKSNP